MAKLAKTHDGKGPSPSLLGCQPAAVRCPGLRRLRVASLARAESARRGRVGLLGAGRCPRNGVLWRSGTGALFRAGCWGSEFCSDSRASRERLAREDPWEERGGGGEEVALAPWVLALAFGSGKALHDGGGGGFRAALNGVRSTAGLLFQTSVKAASPAGQAMLWWLLREMFLGIHTVLSAYALILFGVTCFSLRAGCWRTRRKKKAGFMNLPKLSG